MTFFIRIFTLLSLCCTYPLAAYAQEVPRLSEERLLSIANGELEGFAERGGYRLLQDRSSLSVPDTTVATEFLLATVSAVTFVNFIFGVVVRATIPVVANVIGLIAIASDIKSHDKPIYEEPFYVPFVSHYRSEFHYVLVEEASKERIEGSCLYFFRADESGYTLDIEIDNCSHDAIFPQEAVGTMRVGDSVDFFEQRFSDQDEVVVSTNVPIQPR